MAHSREVRLPFLSHELVEFAFSLPASTKIRNGFTKWALRQSMEKLLPSQIVWRKDKVGFEPPQQQWMNDSAVKDMVQESKRKLAQQGILRQSVLSQPVVATAAHAADNTDWRFLSAAMTLY
jgi:asparagine synthase (glutamine-hydrolysing)